MGRGRRGSQRWLRVKPLAQDGKLRAPGQCWPRGVNPVRRQQILIADSVQLARMLTAPGLHDQIARSCAPRSAGRWAAMCRRQPAPRWPPLM